MSFKCKNTAEGVPYLPHKSYEDWHVYCNADWFGYVMVRDLDNCYWLVSLSDGEGNDSTFKIDAPLPGNSQLPVKCYDSNDSSFTKCDSGGPLVFTTKSGVLFELSYLNNATLRDYFNDSSGYYSLHGKDVFSFLAESRDDSGSTKLSRTLTRHESVDECGSNLRKEYCSAGTPVLKVDKMYRIYIDGELSELESPHSDESIELKLENDELHALCPEKLKLIYESEGIDGLRKLYPEIAFAGDGIDRPHN